MGQTRIKVEGFPRGLLYLFLHKVSGTAKSYGAFWRCVFDQLFVRLPSETRFVVDSSKTTWSRLFRPFALRTIAGLDVKMVHLVRDGRGCIWSNLRGEDNGLLDNQNLLQRLRFPAARTAFHWALANLAAHGFRLAYGSDRYCRVNYEELVGDPTATCRRVERFLGVQDGRGWIIGDKVTFALDHLIAGNRMRSHRSTDIRLDDEWREHLTPGKQALFWLINWPLALWYGYRI